MPGWPRHRQQWQRRDNPRVVSLLLFGQCVALPPVPEPDISGHRRTRGMSGLIGCRTDGDLLGQSSRANGSQCGAIPQTVRYVSTEKRAVEVAVLATPVSRW